jgi:hypothetical protein
MEVNELVLDGLMESFEVAIGLWVSGVIEEVNEATFPAIVVEVFFKFTVVIGLDPYNSERSCSYKLIEEVAAVG